MHQLPGAYGEYSKGPGVQVVAFRTRGWTSAANHVVVIPDAIAVSLADK